MEATTHPTPPPAKWALALSGIFHPLLVPSLMYVLLVLINPFLFGVRGLGEPVALKTLVMLVAYTVIIPLISVLLMRALDMVTSVMMEDRMERIGPLLLVMIIYFWVYYNLSQSNQIPTIFSAFLLGSVLALAVAFVVNVMDKISLHTVGMGGLTGMVLICTLVFGGDGIELGSWSVHLGLVLFFTVLLAGLVGTARLALGAHTHVQLYTGYLIGVLCQAVAFVFYF